MGSEKPANRERRTRISDRKKPGWINRPGLEVLGEDA
jgi:hypothetical protein